MNIQKMRLANTQHALVYQRGGGARFSGVEQYKVGESLKLTQDCDLAVDEGMMSMPAGAIARVTANDGIHVVLDLGEELGGKFHLPKQEVVKYFERYTPVRESLDEANPTVATPGRRVRVARYDPVVGTNRGPKSPGLGGYNVLVGQEGEVTSIYGQISGIKTYRVNLVQGGQFVFGETELEWLGESESKRVKKEIDPVALHALGYGMV